jgi:Domain of unknown function (DUF4395)
MFANSITAEKFVEEKIDRSALRFNQAAIVILVSIAFLFNLNWLIALVSLVMLVGTLLPKVGLFKLTYCYVAKPLGIIKPQIINESNTPHLFAQGLGGVVLAAAFLLLNFTDQNIIGWFLSIVVVALAFINLTVNFCVGCYIYYQLTKIGIFSNYPGKQHV